jgi:predicted Zn-dependent peptidase
MAPVEFVQTEPRVMLETRESDQAHLRLGVRGLQTTSPDRYAMQVLTTVLGGGMSSRLFLEVRERLGLAYYVYGYHQSYHDTGTLFAQAGVDVARIDQAVGTIGREFRKLAAERVPDDELRRCKNYLKGRMVLQLEDPKGLLMFGLRREVLEDRVAEIDEILEGIERVTAEDIQRLARQIVVDDGLNLAIVGPFDDEQRFLDILAA